MLNNLFRHSARASMRQARPGQHRAGAARGISGLAARAAARVPASLRRAEQHQRQQCRQQQQRRALASAAAAKPDISAGALNTAVAVGDLDAAKKLVASGADVNLGDYDARTPLHIAASFNNVEMARWLASEGAVMREDRDSRLPIHDAIQHRNADMTAILESCPYVHERDFGDTFNPELVNTIFERAARHGLFTVNSLDRKLRYFVGDMGLGADYFESFPVQEIAEHFHSFTAACITARTSRNPENICVESAGENDCVILYTDGNKLSVQNKAEHFMMDTPKGMGVTLRYMRSKQAAIPGATQTLNIYHIQRSRFADGTEVKPEAEVSQVFGASETATEAFLSHTDPARVERVNRLLAKVQGKCNTVMAANELDGPDGKSSEVMFAVPTGSVANDAVFLRSISDTFMRLGHISQGGGIDKFSNGVAVYTMRCAGLERAGGGDALRDLESYANLAFTQFRSPLFEKYAAGKMSGRQLLYFHAACRFTHYFEYEKNEDLVDLYAAFKDNPMLLDRVSSLDKSLGTYLHTLGELYKCVTKHQSVAEELYADFARRMTGDLEGYVYPDVESLLKKVPDPQDRHMLHTFHLFNQSVTSTNLWKKTKSAAAFRMDPSVFLKDHNIPEIPFAIFMVLGLDFTGFHVRFRDISRGGVRIIKSTPESYETNRKSQFLENFNLAYTQKLKNKDIPESGSKGTILLKQGKNDRDELAFQQYVDCILDITMKAEGVIDLYEQDEYIFLGPDENTAGFMDGACEYAKTRGYEFWRAFTTGKGPQLGGIPHDTYGMTTRSVRSFVKGIMRRLDLKEEDCTKFITGGPDGDLGSNEIIMGRERVVGVVDGSGVLYDPQGLHDEALKDLARQRVMVENFDASLLSSDGFFVHVNGRDQKISTGEVVRNGVDFRNNFHVWDNLQADFFVPCGGRPESIHKGNVGKILMADGRPRFKYIVEGANLFITESARNVLQDEGVLLFKDASTNKGGVTSSSLEVLAGLSMTDEEFAQHMQADAEGNVPEFYARYVEEVIRAVEANATAEFNYIYDESQRSGRRSTEVTRLLSEEMNELNDMITHSDLFDSEALRREVLHKSVPGVLQQTVGLDNIMERVPQQYQRAIFAMYLSSRFVYENGSDNSTYNFYKFMQRFEAKPNVSV